LKAGLLYSLLAGVYGLSVYKMSTEIIRSSVIILAHAIKKELKKKRKAEKAKKCMGETMDRQTRDVWCIEQFTES